MRLKLFFRYFLVSVIVISITKNKVYAQVTEEWVQRYHGPGNGYDVPTSMAVDGTGNVYVTGHCAGSGTNTDYATIKYNSKGEQQWCSFYNGSVNNWDKASSIAVDASGNVYVTGNSIESSAKAYIATIKYNSEGGQEWVAIYSGTANGPNQTNDAYAIAVDTLGNVYVTGYCYNIGTSADYATIKYNSAGMQQWVAIYNGPSGVYDDAHAIAVDDLGNVYVTGSSGGSTSYDYATLKYNSSGVQQWVARYNGTGNNDDWAFSIAVDQIGYVIVTGQSEASGTDTDMATIMYSPKGEMLWYRRYNGPGNKADRGSTVKVDASSNVYVTGSSDGGTSGMDYV